MVEYFDDKDLNGKVVLIPLAGKTRDIIYFLDRGAKVIAIEVVEKAVEEFFADNNINYQRNGNIYQATNLDFYCDDFFKATSYVEEDIDYVFDRASNVALPGTMRLKYYDIISELVNDKTNILIITFHHDGPLDFGPPFSIPFAEIKENYKRNGINMSYVIYDNMKMESQKYQNAGISHVDRIKWTRI